MDILEYLTSRAGQTQEGRLPAGLAPHFADVDERVSSDLLAYAKRLAGQVNFFDVSGGALDSSGDWTPFFDRALPAARDGTTPAHFALFAAFLKLCRIPRCLTNSIGARHLDFFYRQVLGFALREPQPDHAHLLIELKKGAAKTEINPGHSFSAGKDASGAEQIYSPVGQTVIGQAGVASLRSVFVDPANGGTVCFAPQADSADGLGAPLAGDQANWSAFGGAALPAAPIGFAVASPVLRMSEGSRKITLTLKLDGLGSAVTATQLAGRLECFVTGQTHWLGPYAPDPAPAGSSLILSFTVPAGEEAVVDYDPAKHAHAFAATAPVVQVLVKVEDESNKPQGYRDLVPLVVVSASVAVAVSGVQTLDLQSDSGSLDPKRAFMPFGPQPVAGSRFMVGCPEALSKTLTAISLQLQWLPLPDFGKVYAGYQSVSAARTAFTAHAALRDAAGDETGAQQRPLFPASGDTLTMDLTPGKTAGGIAVLEPLLAVQFRALSTGGGVWFAQAARRELLRTPVYGVAAGPPPAPTPGFITLRLDRDFGHAEYRSKLLAGAPLASEPYTPTLGALTLAYGASSPTALIDSTKQEDFASPDVAFFHVGCFGQRREHAWLRSQFPFADNRRVPLFPSYTDEGELLIGLGGVIAGDSVSLLFKVAEGSADPDIDPQPSVRWSALCNDYWRPLDDNPVRDGTDNLLRTGIVAAAIPLEATTQNSFLPSGMLWLKASVKKDVTGVCALMGVAANAVEVERVAGGGTAPRLWTPLPKGSIARLKTPVATVKGVTQPYATFGGTALESDEALDIRAAERLRHRARAITAWDYERLVLAAFPEVREVKCIPHCANSGDWIEPGNVTVVVVPDLRLRNAVDPLQPKVDADTVSRIRGHLESCSPMRIGVHVRNPRYQRIRLDFKVRFMPGFEFNFYAKDLEQRLIAHLSPWLLDPGAAIAFGGAVYKSQLIDFVEHTDYVDFVTDFRMYDLSGGPSDSNDVSEAQAATPDAILVSDATHAIGPVPDSATASP